MNSTPVRELVYRIDADSTILSFSDGWSDFFRNNVAQGTAIPNYVGTRLWTHVSDPTTVHLYQAIIARVRRTGKELAIPFRCDSPDKRRFMQMHVSDAGAGAIEFRSVILREEPRTPVPLFSLSPRPSAELIHMCSWCKKVSLPDWVEVEEAVRRLELFHSESIPRITHTICQSCSEILRREIERLN
ncbi:MAG TPA: hypothetical protein VK327_15710 [Candidatus Paceibacterota bacterium]|nr:hypothetical protein [Candidatus Paceibacterota bacterium]